MLALFEVPGFAFDPFIRGVLVVAVGVLVLMGSVYLILATNSGARTGMLLALTGLFGWMFIMGVIWTIYGIGWAGSSPTWNVMEVNRGDLAQARFDNARSLGEAIDDELGSPEAVEDLFLEREESGESPRIGPWRGMLLSNPARGEAQATVDAFLTGPGEEFKSNLEYLPVAAFETGGKKKSAVPLRCKVTQINTYDECVKRAGWKLRTVFVQPLHPPRYAVIMVQAVEDRTLVQRPGQAPARKVTDREKPIVSVVMVRDLGNKRVKPFGVTFGSLLLFAGFAWRLHERDKLESANRAQLPAGS